MQKPNQAIAPAQIRTMAQRVEDRMLIIIAGRQDGSHSPELRAAYAAELEQMRRQLGASVHSDPLERLLIERIVLTWVRLQWCEEQAAYTLMGDATVTMAEHWDRRLDHAHSRFLKVCTALARIRKLQPSRTPGEIAIEAVLGDTITRGLRVAGKLIAGKKGRTSDRLEAISE